MTMSDEWIAALMQKHSTITLGLRKDHGGSMIIVPKVIIYTSNEFLGKLLKKKYPRGMLQPHYFLMQHKHARAILKDMFSFLRNQKKEAARLVLMFFKNQDERLQEKEKIGYLPEDYELIEKLQAFKTKGQRIREWNLKVLYEQIYGQRRGV